MRYSPFLLLGGIAAVPASAASVNITIPALKVAEYHKPYVAVWLEPAGGGAARTLSVWYQVKKNDKEPGTKWLSELRAWWRKGGKSLKMPADGISGATRAPGTYSISLPANLPAGAYILNVEAARETGGRELVTLPISVPAKGASASGKTELGAITLSAR
ncbi:hypothetical protein ASE00_04270 [Sphingomonas sp. Root710]|uniref:DUF2271 domain-containing protein n=1 Tax=Sphingomonas sp. Root710 TaxID=1736594 RepID=UPI0006F38F1A|nr:DUF2271 domain-containing protein [Sphingomonas sp. Root710]KRB85971.1 hypothetical protein ASE00_04270 [Sphingomonas sp. Root710]